MNDFLANHGLTRSMRSKAVKRRDSMLAPKPSPRYVAAVYLEDTGCYSVTFPDVPGCVVSAKSVDEFIDKGSAALASYFRNNPEIRPNPARTIDEIKNSPSMYWYMCECPALMWVPVNFPARQGKSPENRALLAGKF